MVIDVVAGGCLCGAVSYECAGGIGPEQVSWGTVDADLPGYPKGWATPP